MTLRIELKPFEELFISRSIIRNGPERVSFAITGTTPLLRGKDHLSEAAADTPCKKLQFAVQTLYLEERDVQEAIPVLEDMAHDVCRRIPSLAPQLATILNQINAGNLFKVLKICRGLVEIEAVTCFSDTAA